MPKTSNYFEEYTDFINEIQNKIMRIQLRYNECQMLINREYEQGRITKEMADKMLSVRINEYVPSIDEKYRLSKSEIDFINEYAALDNNGEILVSIIRPEYLEKSEQLNHIVHSVRTLDFYDKMDHTSKRIKLKADLTEAFERRISTLKGQLHTLIKNKGETVKNTSLYQKIVDDINRCKSTIESFDEIMDYDDLKLMQLIVSFYKVDYSYYEWFKKMELKDVKETGELYTTHTNTMENANNFGNDILDNNEKIKGLNERLEKLKNSLFDFINYTLEFNIKEYEQEKPKKGGLFKKIKPNNKETLLQIFSSFATLSSFINYLEENYKKPEDKSIEVTECFNKYFETTYGNEIEYIEVEKFFLEFQKTILNYLKTKIDDTQKEIVKYNKLNNGAMIALVKSVEKGYNEAILQEMAYNSTVLYPNQLQIKGYTPEELEQMYNSLKEILSNNYLQQEPTTKKKK